jgi:putative membrane protein
MQWWCSALGTAWSWDWRPYPGVWLFILSIALLRQTLVRRARAAGLPTRRSQTAAFFAGLVLLWIALDWPVGALGAGYLASMHMLQFVLIAMATPPLLLLGLPRAALPAPRRGSTRAVARLLAHPLVALLLFNAVVMATHLPIVTDRLMPTQAGSFLVDMLWWLGGLLYWWPLLAPARRAWFAPPVQIAYLFASMVFMTAPGAMITFSELPIYATYELAPPIPGISALQDQRLAGIGMRFGGSSILLLAISIVFLRWNRAEERLMEVERAEGAEASQSGN